MTLAPHAKAMVVAAAAVCFSMSVAADPTEFEIAPAQGDMLWSDQAIAIRGAWTAAAPYQWPLVHTSNATSIECHREAMRCLESVAEVGRAKGASPSSPPRLIPLALFYDIQSWTDGVVIASRTNTRLEIDAKHGTVRLNWAQGPNDAAYFLPARQEFTVPIKNRYQTPFQGGTRWWSPYVKS